MDDLDKMIFHQDFCKILTLVVKVNYLHENIYGKNTRRKKELDANDVINAVTGLKQRILKSNKSNNSSSRESPVVVIRGTYPLTDSLIDDSVSILQREFDDCQQLMIHQRKQQKIINNKNNSEQKRRVGSGNKKRKHSSKAIAIKYPKWKCDILFSWMIQHIDHPYPNSGEVLELARKTGLSRSQVVNWTTNVRKRSCKATCEKGKKPYKFIDFLFLAQDRDNRRKYSKQAQSGSDNNGSPHQPPQQQKQQHQREAEEQSNRVNFPRKKTAKQEDETDDINAFAHSLDINSLLLDPMNLYEEPDARMLEDFITNWGNIDEEESNEALQLLDEHKN